MAAQVRLRDAGGTLRTVSRIRMRDETGALRLIQRIRMRDTGGVLRTVWQSMTASLSPTSLSQFGTTATIVTASCTCTPSGGTAPYTYSWEAGAFAFDLVNPTTPTADTTTFRRTGCVAGNDYIGDFTCLVTDALGATARSDVVNVTISR